jgi:hypothetical protein
MQLTPPPGSPGHGLRMRRQLFYNKFTLACFGKVFQNLPGSASPESMATNQVK